jgi:hypothetical protein
MVLANPMHESLAYCLLRARGVYSAIYSAIYLAFHLAKRLDNAIVFVPHRICNVAKARIADD